MTIHFRPVIDDLIAYVNSHPSRPVPVSDKRQLGRTDGFGVLWAGGGVELSLITAEVRVNLEVWANRDDPLADVRAEEWAAVLCGIVSSRPGERHRTPRVFDVEWSSMPAVLPAASSEGDNLDAARWARVVAQCVVKTRGIRLGSPD